MVAPVPLVAGAAQPQTGRACSRAPAAQGVQRHAYHHARQPAPRLAALPPDAVEALPAAAAAAAASLLTAAWLRRPGAEHDASQESSAAPEEQPLPAAEADDGLTSPEAIWAAAWQGFAPPPPQQHAAAADSAAAGQPAAQAQQQEAAPSQDTLRRSPVLLLEGIRSSDRSRLVALCLAALEAQVAALPPGAGLLGAGGVQWRQLAAALLALSSLAAAAGWLGYTPARLVQAAAQRLAAVDPAVLRAAGLQDVAAAVVQQAAAASAASGGEEEEEDDGTAVAWYCLEEKLQLYSSVLRLLTCASIQAHMRQEAAALQLPALASRSTASINGDELQPAGAALAGASASSSALARQQAMAALQQKQEQLGGGPGSIRGWRATAAGARSESQLLALAPSALQDMAVTAADAVAAAYLADAADAGPSAVARGAGAGEAAAAAAAQPVARQDGSEQQRRRRRGDRQQQAAALVALARDGTSSSGSGSSAPLEAGWWPTFVHRQLGSSRQLQRFCNAVQLQRWWHRQYQGVADMYEDRLRLWTLADGGRRLQPRLAPVKRTAELGRLRGLRYAASLLLEGVDVLAPLLRTLWRQATAAASWLLVRLVGQAVALFRRGVQQGSQAAAAAAPGASQQRRPGRRRQAQQAQGGPGEDAQQQQPVSGQQPGWAW